LFLLVLFLLDTSPTQRDVMSPTQEETTMHIPNDGNRRTTFGLWQTQIQGTKVDG
jgi:hypothetical protein